MVEPAEFYECLCAHGLTFFTGVPDSLLKDLCACISDRALPENHIISANEGSSVALAIGYHLATAQIPVVYLQNSGIGNLINPLLSLADPAVYGVPMLLIMGWRGEPGIPDEPQHAAQGRVMVPLLQAIDLTFDILDAHSSDHAALIAMARSRMAESGRSHVFLIRRDTFAPYRRPSEPGPYSLTREDALTEVLAAVEKPDIVVATTGMTSREVFEIRHRSGNDHRLDFLTVGGMGHSSQIALGLAERQPSRRVFCLDGDGAAIMHLGSLAIIGSRRPSNFVHIVLNNGAHDSVGGQPTVAFAIDLCAIASACGYRRVERVTEAEALRSALPWLRSTSGPTMLEIRVRKGARADLGRPTIGPRENKRAFMEAMKS